MSFLNTLNYIKKLSYYPCADPGPVIYVETALKAAIPILYEVLGFSCLDIVKLRAGISWKCGRAIRAVIKAGHPPDVVDNLHFIYRFVAPLERALWYMFVAEEASKFVALWSSLIYEMQNCQVPWGNPAEIDWTDISTGSPGSWNDLHTVSVGNTTCIGLNGAGLMTIPFGCQGEANLILKSSRYVVYPVPGFSMRMTCLETGEVTDFGHSLRINDDESIGHIWTQFPAPPLPGEFHYQLQYNPDDLMIMSVSGHSQGGGVNGAIRRSSCNLQPIDYTHI